MLLVGNSMVKITTLLLLLSLSLFARDVIDESGSCKINWSQGHIICEGESEAGQTRFAAKIAAKVIAQRNLLEVVQGVRIDSLTTVRDGLLSSDVIRSRVQGVIRGAQIVSNEYIKNDGYAVAKVKLTMGSDLLNALLSDPKKLTWNEKIEKFWNNISFIAQANASTYTHKDTDVVKKVMQDLRDGGYKKASDYIQTLLEKSDKNNYTGILIDVSGLNSFKKAMIVRLVDAKGKEIYPGNLITKKMLVKKNTSVGYIFGHNDALQNKRVFNDPIEIKAKNIYKNRHSDILLDASQLEKISSLDKSIFENAKILLLLGE